MKRQLSLLGWVCILLLASCILLWQLSGYERDADYYTDRESANMKMLLDINTADIQRILVTQNKEEYSICRQDGMWTVEGYQAEQMSQGMLADCVKAASSLYVEEIDISGNNLEEFGLAEPAAWVDVEWNDGSYCFGIGAEAPALAGVYIRPEEKESVFLLRNTEILTFLQLPLGFVDKTIVPEFKKYQTEGTFWLPEKIELYGQVREEALSLEYDAETDTLKLTSPFSQVLYSQKLRENLQKIVTLEAGEVVSYGASDEEYQKYGLAEEYSVVLLEWKEEQRQEAYGCKLIISKPANDKCYVTREGSGIICVVETETIPWYELTIEDLFSTIFFLPDIAELSEILVAGSGREEIYEISEEGNYQLADGRKIPEDRFKQFYRSLIGIPAEKYVSQEPKEDAEKLLSITYRYKDGRADDIVVLTEESTLQMYISLNGRTEFLTNRQHLEVLLWNIDNLMKEEKLEFFY